MLTMPDARTLMALGDREGLKPTRRDDVLLAGFDPELSAAAAAAMTVAARETRLLDIWDGCFGGEMEATAICPQCGARLEVAFSSASLRQPAMVAGWQPTGEDLHAIEHCQDVASARALLLQRSGLTAAAAAALAAANAQADVWLALDCAVCGHAWEAGFEAGAFVWSRVQRLTAELTAQVHVLARAYHWSEDAILAMPEKRRARYLLALAEAGS